jgi:hypothetical protein
MTTVTFYREQAQREQAEADSAILVNLRAKAQSAANAWTLLADQLQLRDRRRAARLAREAAAAAIEAPSENPDRGRSEGIMLRAANQGASA